MTSGTREATGDAGGHPDPLRRILMLVPHDPYVDPRIQWVKKLCADRARTEILAIVNSPVGPSVCYDGVVSVEQFPRALYAQPRGPCLNTFMNWLGRQAAFSRFANRALHGQQALPANLAERLRRAWDYHWGGFCYTLVVLEDSLRQLIGPMTARVRAVPVPPKLVICHEVWTLAAGLELKRRYGTRVIYDAHEFTPHARLAAHPLERWAWQQYEKRLARRVDAFITVTPQIAAEFKRWYGLGCVYSVPNAEPFARPRAPSCDRPPHQPVRFLIQGMASPGRGLEQLLDGWRRLDDSRAVLLIRCPRWGYVDALEAAYGDLIAKGAVRFLAAVKTEELVEAATAADVGVIPYPIKVAEYTRNVNHLYCCPNKLSQYMQAGLAVLSSNSVFISSCLKKYDSGLVYDPEKLDSLTRAVKALLDDPAGLARMKRNALEWARDEFNWEVQSLPYRRLIEGFTRGARAAPRAPTRKAA